MSWVWIVTNFWICIYPWIWVWEREEFWELSLPHFIFYLWCWYVPFRSLRGFWPGIPGFWWWLSGSGRCEWGCNWRGPAWLYRNWMWFWRPLTYKACIVQLAANTSIVCIATLLNTYSICPALMTYLFQISARVSSLRVGRRSAAPLLSFSSGKMGINWGTRSGWPSSSMLLGSEGLYICR